MEYLCLLLWKIALTTGNVGWVIILEYYIWRIEILYTKSLRVIVWNKKTQLHTCRYHQPLKYQEDNVFTHVCLVREEERSPYDHYPRCIALHCTAVPPLSPSPGTSHLDIRHGTPQSWSWSNWTSDTGLLC